MTANTLMEVVKDILSRGEKVEIFNDGEKVILNAVSVGEQNAPEQPQEPENVKRHRELCDSLNRLYAAKNADYGNSFHKSYVEWGLPMTAIRLGDKYNRFCRLIRNEANVKDESIRDTLIDLANYAIMTVMEIDRDAE